jgi:SAM-dependent methyltransferase
MDAGGKEHWETVFRTKADDEVSWFEAAPGLSLTLIRRAIASGARSIIDVGGGTSRLVDALLQEHLERLAVLDISEAALQRTKERLGSRAGDVEWIVADIRDEPDLGPFDIWHDRALFHFLTAEDDRLRYRRLLERTLGEQGTAIIATFGPEGPQTCSGLDVHHYDAGALGRELGPGFALEGSDIIQHVTPHGRHQQFLYAVFGRSAA